MKNTITVRAIAFAGIVYEEARKVFAYYGSGFGWLKTEPVLSDTPIYDQLEREWARTYRIHR